MNNLKKAWVTNMSDNDYLYSFFHVFDGANPKVSISTHVIKVIEYL